MSPRVELEGLETDRDLRKARGFPLLEELWRDLRTAARSLRRDFGFAFVAISILAIGLAANAVVVGFVDTILLRPLPFSEPDRLVWIQNGERGETNPSGLASRVLVFEGWRDHSRTVADMAAFSPFFTRATWALTGGGQEPERLQAVRVTDNFLPLLGVPLEIGRTFTSEEVNAGGPGAVILSHDLWQRRFGGDRDIVGETVELNDEPRTVVGVTPADFDFGSVFAPGYDVDLLLPAALEIMADWGNTLSVVGRLAPETTVDGARGEIEAITARLLEERPELEGWSAFGRTESLEDHVRGSLREPLGFLWGAVGVLLLLVAVNLSNLMAVRGLQRRREMAVRTALGAGRARLARQLITESLVLALCGFGLAMVLARTTLHAFVDSRVVVLPLLDRVEMSGTVIGLSALCAVLLALAIGTVPIRQLFGNDPSAGLGASVRGTVGDRRTSAARAALVVAEVALAAVLLVAAGLLLRSFAAVLDVDLGFETERRVTFPLHAGARYADEAEVLQFQQRIVDSLEALPGVLAVGLTDNLPLDGNRTWGLWRSDVPRTEENVLGAFVRLVDPGYFDAMGIERRGREFASGDRGGGDPVVVLNRTAAALLFPGEDPIDRLVANFSGDLRVVGVVGDVRHNGLEEESGPEMYLPLSQWSVRSVSVVVRSRTLPGTLAGPIREALRDVDPLVPFQGVRPLGHLVDRALSPRRFVVGLLVGFAGIALLLAALGLFGVLSHSVRQRRAEIGVRLALGARPRRVLGEELRRGLQPAVFGLALGIGAALAGSRIVASQLYAVAPTDPATYGVVAGVLLASAVVASGLPALRAARVHPIVALRGE